MRQIAETFTTDWWLLQFERGGKSGLPAFFACRGMHSERCYLRECGCAKLELVIRSFLLRSKVANPEDAEDNCEVR
jgi:hypothetical protein